uniref:Uncharacterized protein n=1 Tax=Amphimedon queenslandica TaxID=400682 RepID=A0A1X7TY46_AMPQE
TIDLLSLPNHLPAPTASQSSCCCSHTISCSDCHTISQLSLRCKPSALTTKPTSCSP